MKTFIGTCLLLMSPILLRAQVTSPHIGFLSGGDLVAQCRNEPSNNSIDYFTPCTAYILGVQVGIAQAWRTNPKDGIPICISMGTPQDQLVGAVLKYAETHPEDLKAPAWKIVIDSPLIDFRCPNSK
jgi:Rap1a immunity proteins